MLNMSSPGRSYGTPDATVIAPALATQVSPGWWSVLAGKRARPTRKPLLLFRLSGSFLLRLAARMFLGLLFQEPPRRTRV